MFLISMAVGSSILKVISVDFIPSIMLWDHDCSQTNLVFDTRLFHFKMEIFSELSVSSRIELTFWINIYLETSRACFSISSKMGHLQLIVPPPNFFLCLRLLLCEAIKSGRLSSFQISGIVYSRGELPSVLWKELKLYLRLFHPYRLLNISSMYMIFTFR